MSVICHPVLSGKCTWVVLGVLSMQLLGKLLVWMRLDAQSLVDGQDLEQERQPVLILLGDLGRQQSLVFLYKFEEASLGF